MKKITLLIYCRLSVLSLTFLLSAVVSLTYSQSLTINEIMSSNASTIADEDGDFEDWIEIYNFGTTPVTLNYFGLSDTYSEPYRWIFPDVTVQPGEFIIVWTSGKNRTNPSAPLHTNFSIKAEGEEVLLTSPFGTLTSLVQPVAIMADVSYGRSPDGTGNYFFFATPTPGYSNNTTPFSEIVEPPVFSHHGGFYTEDFDLSLSHPDPSVTIIFTLDGSYPDIENLEGTIYTYKNQYPENPGDPFGELIPGSYLSYIYTDSIFITDRLTVPDSITQISSTWHNVPFYIPENPVFKGTVIRARALKSGALSSPVCTNTYFITSQGQARYSLPVISLSIPEYELFDYEEGIYVAGVDYDNWRIANPTASNSWSTVCNFDRRGDEWEIRSHVEFYDPEAAFPKISQEIGIRVHGSEARRRPMKSLRLYARGEYGKSELQHKFFSKLDDQSFKRILMRNSGQDFLSTMMRDAAIHTMTDGLHFDTQEYEPAIAFINGEYWGIHNIRERYDKYYFERVYSVDPENLDYISNTGVNEGDTVHYNQTICYIQQNGLVDEAHYQYIQTRIDVENFTDYQIANIYSDNLDWPGNNLEFWRLRTPGYNPNAPYGHDGRWRWLLYDMDFCFGMWSGSPAALHNTLEMATLAGGTAYPNPDWATFLLRKFLENDQFRIGFINRFADLMNTYFYPSRVISVIDQLSARIAPEMPEHIMRWKIPDNISVWWYFLQEMRDFATIRPIYQRQHIIDHFGLDGEVELTLDVLNQSNGYIRINTVEINENTPGVDSVPYPWTGTYFKGIPIEIEAIPAPGYAFSHWRGLPCGTPQVATVTPEENISIRAHFVETIAPQLLYFWIFNTSLPNDLPLQQINAKFQLPGEGYIQFHSALQGYPFYAGHPSWRKASMERRNAPTEINYRPEGNNGVSYAASYMRGLQVKQPFSGDAGENIMTFLLPSEGYHDLVFKFAAKDEGAAEYLLPEYSIAPGDSLWITTGLPADTLSLGNNYQLYEIDFCGIESVNDNPDFKIRIRFGGSNMSADQGNRATFNNFSLDGKPLGLQNLPPVVINPVGFQSLIEAGQPLIINLDEVFSDPENDPLFFMCSSDNEQFVSYTLNDDSLMVIPIQRGGATITLSANDGHDNLVMTSFRILIYPEAFQYMRNVYSFTSWNSTEPEYSYPPNMIFLQSNMENPGLEEPLIYPYFIPHDDYHPNDQGTIGFPYNNTGWTRINGLGEDGISFINTGRNRDLGGVLLAVDTRGVSSASVSWVAGTISQTPGMHALRLQYRTDLNGLFSDFLVNGQPVEYIADFSGHVMQFEPVPLPPELLNNEYVQLLWRYYLYSGDPGSETEIRLDEIYLDNISSASEVNPATISVYYSGNSFLIKIPAATAGTINILDITGRLLVTQSLQATSDNKVHTSLKNGIYILQIISGDQILVEKIITGY